MLQVCSAHRFCQGGRGSSFLPPDPFRVLHAEFKRQAGVGSKSGGRMGAHVPVSLDGLQGMLSILRQTRRGRGCILSSPALPESHPLLVCCSIQPDQFPFPFVLGVEGSCFTEGRTKSALRDRLRHLSPVQKAVGSKASSGEESPGKTCPLSPRSLCSLHLTLEAPWGSRQGQP